ncbi:MAG TPA: type II toxin-antitoxin system VapC family toxin [Pirellulales bacterium]|nr:type II toxin-antitoxin system VapC family toxin [Pirellulales bacterium]
MRLLLDSHAFLWFTWNHKNLSQIARAAIIDPTNEMLLSIASCWEIAIKVGVGKLTLTEPIDVFLPGAIADNGLTVLPVELRHVLTLERLPLHHRDPFDRILIAQAIVEQVAIVSNDKAFDSYPVTRIW